jgi:beta-galactosidase
MYARSRNHTSIIGFSLGRNSGNGYNMYKAYQWLRQTEPTLPVFYVGADGEWNTDDPEGRVLKP